MFTERVIVIITSGHLPHPVPSRDGPLTHSTAAAWPKVPSSKFTCTLKPQKMSTSHAGDCSPPSKVHPSGPLQSSSSPSKASYSRRALAAHTVGLSPHKCLGQSLCIRQQVPTLLPRPRRGRFGNAVLQVGLEPFLHPAHASSTPLPCWGKKAGW